MVTWEGSAQGIPVDIELLASDAVYDEAPAAPRDADVVSGERRTYAQIAKDTSYTQAREARVRAEEQRKEEIAAKVAEERKQREMRKKDKEKKRKEELEKKRAEKDSLSDSGSDDQEDSGRGKGFSIPRDPFLTDWSAPELDRPKRHLVSPGTLAPGSKNVKLTHEDGEPRRGPGIL